MVQDILAEVPANPHTAVKQYFEEKDRREGNEGKSILERAKEAMEDAVDSVKDRATAFKCMVTGSMDSNDSDYGRTEEVLPDPEVLEELLPPKEKVMEMEREFLQQPTPSNPSKPAKDKMSWLKSMGRRFSHTSLTKKEQWSSQKQNSV